MATVLDTQRVRRCTPSQLRDYYKRIQYDAAEEVITRQILQAIERGSVAPFPTFAIWVGVTKSAVAIRSGLQQNFSVVVRASSIKHLGKSFCSSRWAATLEQLGGISGLLNLFADMSVNEVRDTCRTLGRCARSNGILGKRASITELFMGLQPDIFPDILATTSDRRPLGRYYRYLIPSCTEELVKRIVSGDLQGKWNNVRDKPLMQYYPDVMRRQPSRTLQGEDEGEETAIDNKRISDLLTYYPQGRDTETGFSLSMDYAMRVLRSLSAGTGQELDDEAFINVLVRPLLRRALKKKMDWSVVREIVDLTVQHLEAHPATHKEITSIPGDVLHLVALCWAHQPGTFEKHLRKLCSSSESGASTQDFFDEWTDLVVKTPKHRRYAVLQLCCQESAKLDLSNDDDLKKVRGSLSHDLLESLRPSEAFSLFIRLRAARGNDSFLTINAGKSTLDIEPAYNASGVDADLYHVMLLARNGAHKAARTLATERLEARKQKSQRASSPEQRGFYAQSALCYSIASNDLDIYRSTLEWTKRFLGDPQVLPSLYSRYGHKSEAITLLSGIPPYPTNLTKSEVCGRVFSGNAILQSMFDTACLAIREPSFQFYDWQGTLSLFQEVVQERIKKSDVLQKELRASDEEMYDLLWKDTLEMLLAVESKANRPESIRLEANTVRGPLGWGNGRYGFNLKGQQKHTYTFFDNLARARDAFWRELRSTVHPATLALPEPLTRGLPIQFLTGPFTLDTPGLEVFAPYIASRANAVIFQDPTNALEPVTGDEESLEAIGGFIDSYQYALSLHVPESCSEHERTERIQEVWGHAKGPLTQARMDDEEAMSWWQSKAPSHLKRCWPQNQKTNESHRVWPLIPDVEDPSQPTEWNPFEAGRPNRPKRDLGKLTYLDLSLLVLDRTPTVAQIWKKSPMMESIPTVPAHEVDKSQLWDPRRKMDEGGVLSALLYLEMLHGAPHGRLLQTPFPSADDARYPSLYLDDGFQGDPLNPYNAVQYIWGRLNAFPPSLLHLSTQNTMSKLRAFDRKEHEDHSIQELALTLLVRLSESDRPSLAQNLALQTIIGRPEASSWHRQLLKLSYLRRLPSSDARSCCESLVHAIFEKLSGHRDKRQRLGVEAQDSAQLTANSYVKVTTVKFLAQLLREADFIDQGFAFSVLAKLLKQDTRRDVRSNTAQTLLDMFSTCEPELADKILVALEAIIPLAGNLNENSPATEEAWKIAEESLELPEYPSIEDSLPLFELLFKYYENASKDAERLPIFIERLLLPTLEARQRQISRWVSLFLNKYGVTDSSLVIPLVPQHATTLLKGNGSCYLPRKILEDLVSYVEFKIAPTAPIQALHDKLRTDPAMLKRADVQTWFGLFGSGADALHMFRRCDILELFDVPTKLSRNSGITPGVVMEQFLKIYKIAVWADAPMYQRLPGSLLGNLVEGTYLTKTWWKTHGKAIVGGMIAYVEAIRTDSWCKDQDRKPGILPDTFPWRLLLLDFPWPSKNDTREDECEQFADKLARTIIEISSTVYHTKLQRIKDYLVLDPVSSSHKRKEKRIGSTTIFYNKRDALYDQLMRNRLFMAAYLGEVHAQHPHTITTADVLRVEVASHVFRLVQDEWEEVADKDLQAKVQACVEGWKICASEEIRRIGYGLEWVSKAQKKGLAIRQNASISIDSSSSSFTTSSGSS